MNDDSEHTSALIDEFNEFHFTVLVDGRFRIGRYEPSTGFVTLYNKTELMHHYANLPLITVGKRQMPFIAYWLQHPNRRTYEGFVYEPNTPREIADQYYNLWPEFENVAWLQRRAIGSTTWAWLVRSDLKSCESTLPFTLASCYGY
jgi:hypothetical protein